MVMTKIVVTCGVLKFMLHWYEKFLLSFSGCEC